MRPVRRSAILALASAFAAATVVVVTASPASAHICPVPDQIAVGRPASIDVGVTVEDATVPDVEIDIPAGLQLNRVDPKAGWTFTRTGSTVRYHGGPIAAFTCEYFSLGVTAPAKGTFGVPVVQRTAAGKVVSRTTPDPSSAQDRALDQFVYAGVSPPPGSGGTSGMSVTTIAGIVLVVAGVAALGFFRIRARRNRPDREAEIDARLEQFKKRT